MNVSITAASLLSILCLNHQAVQAAFSPATAALQTPIGGCSINLTPSKMTATSSSSSSLSSSSFPSLPQLRMRCSANSISPARHSAHGQLSGRRRRPSPSTSSPSFVAPPYCSPPQSQSTLSKMMFHFGSTKRRLGINRAFSLHAHGKEKSPYLEDAPMADEDVSAHVMGDFELETQHEHAIPKSNDNADGDVAIHLMENGISSNDTPSSTPKLWGIPIQSIILLNLVAVIWGTQHAVIKSVVDDSTSIDFFQSGLFLPFFKWMEHRLGFSSEDTMSSLSTSSLSGYFAGIGKNMGETDDANAAYFTLARFSLAALLASPYTPGWSLLVDGAKDKFRQRRGVNEEIANNDALEVVGVNESGGDNERSFSNKREVSSPAEVGDTTSINLAWRYGIELGLYMFLGYAFQAIGLETTTASRSGFLLYLNVKLVPFLNYLIFGKSIRKSTWVSALVAFMGTALLSLDNASSAAASSGEADGTTMSLNMAISTGDLWSIAAAAASAMFILRMEAASKAVPNSAELNAANLWTVATLSLAWTIGISWSSLRGSYLDESFMAVLGYSGVLVQSLEQTFRHTIYTIISHPLPLLYLSGVTTALASYIQSRAQKDVTAERASIIYAMDPVYGAFFANALLGEQLGGWGWLGAGFIVIAAATNAICDFGSGEKTEHDEAWKET